MSWRRWSAPATSGAPREDREAHADAPTAVRLSPHEQDRLLVYVAAMVARDRRARGLRLNHPEAVALLTAYVLEGAREGRGVAELASATREVLRRDEVMDGVPEMLPEIQAEATFPDGTKLVTVHAPIP